MAKTKINTVQQMNTLSLVEKFSNRFLGNRAVYGRTICRDTYDENGKRMSKSWLVKQPVTPEVIEEHLSGKTPIGIVPIQENNRVVWGAIDVDIYNNGLSFKPLIDRIRLAKIPLVVLRSKSGGAHLYLFMNEPVLAKQMVSKLEEIAAWLGYGGSEIFPKQVKLGSEDTDTRFGNWINMPYDGPLSLRYALDDNDNKMTLEEFLAFADTHALTEVELASVKPPETPELFSDGPPCLNYIFTQRTQENELRNITLSNATVYLKLAFPEHWESKLNELNQLYANPLADKELTAIKQSYGKKEYHYQCSKEPLCSYCNSRLCRTKKYGVAKNTVLPSNRSLTKLNTSPPIWFLDMDDKRIQLTTDQLFNFNYFSRHCLEVLNYIPASVKNDVWRDTVNAMANKCTIVEVPEEMTPTGLFREIFEDFLISDATEESREHLLRGVPYKNNTEILFRMRDLMDRLKREKFAYFELNRVTQLIKEKPYYAEKHFVKIGQKGVNCWRLANVFESLEPLTPKIMEEEEDVF